MITLRTQFTNWLAVLVFAGLLLAPGLAWIAGFRESAVENRALKPWRAPDWAGLASAEWFADTGNLLVQHLPLRPLAIDLRRTLLLDWMGEDALNGVVIGSQGQLLLGSSMNAWCSASAIAATVERAAAGRREAQAAASAWYWIAIPDKHDVAPELLPGSWQSMGECASRNRQSWSRQMQAELGGQFIDLYPDLRKLAEQGVVPYHPGDTHWTDTGAAVLPARLLAAVLPETGSMIEPSARAGTPVSSDLYLLLGQPERTHVPVRLSVQRPGVRRLDFTRVPTGGRQPLRRYRYGSAGGLAMVPGRTLVVHDSYLLSLFEALAPYFEEVTFVHWNDLERSGVSGQLRGMDRVLLESVDRLALARLSQLQEHPVWLQP